MSMMSWVRKVILWASFCLLTGLAMKADEGRPEAPPDLNCWTDGTHFHGTVKLDETFPEEERVEIIRALDRWRERTGGIVDLRYVGTTPHRPILGPLFFATGDSVKVFRINRFEAIVWPSAYVGYTGFNSFVLMSTRIDDPRELYGVALHEIGHLLELEHSENPDDVMSPSCKHEYCIGIDIQAGDLRQLCREVNRLKRGDRRNGLR